ncbi:hypothetical protein STASHLEY_00300 [Brevundimonas phage vB_BpoS-StAshley]|nr:hypothetical protein STASHLEY_00300 [Brevundimonas phage vB_BpoS-StAshley]UTC30103.1 hypothetical protein MAINES_00640 [Brevundimonas phage vB_BpoS-MaInes]
MRIDNWNLRFMEVLDWHKEAAVSFDWDPARSENLFNCLTFSNSFVVAVTGRDVYKEHAADLNYDTPLQALKTLKSLGFNSVDQLIGSIFEAKDPNFVIRGDLVMIKSTEDTNSPLHLMVAVADPPFYWTVSSTLGLARGNLRDIIKAYSVE